MDKTKELLKALAAQLKAKAVIESCKTSKHCNSARNYIELVYQRFEDLDVYGDLMKHYVDKTIELNK